MFLNRDRYRQIFVRVQSILHFAVASVAVLAMADASLGAVYDSAGFEAPRFRALVLPELEGQDGPPTGPGPWFKVGGSTAVVQTNFPNAGLQSVRVNRDGTDGLWGIAAPAAAGTVNKVTVEADVRVTVAPHPIGPLFGMEAYDSTAGVKLIGGISIDASTGDVLYRRAGTGAWAITGEFLARNAYQHLAMTIDYATKTYSVMANGTLLHTEGFVDSTAVAFSDAPIVARAAGTAGGETGTAYFDNYVITSVVPEPATGAVIVIVAATLAVARRRR